MSTKKRGLGRGLEALLGTGNKGAAPADEPAAATGEGLRTRVGTLPGRPELWAGVWRPTGDLPASGDVAAPETVWAALDCPSFMPLTGRTTGPNVLGTITARQDRPVRLDPHPGGVAGVEGAAVVVADVV